SKFPKISKVFNSQYRVILSGIGKKSFVSVAPFELDEGSHIFIGKGERVPVDLEIIEGKCWVDESVLTGQSYPVQKQEGDFIHAGSLVIEGSLIGLAKSNFFSSTFRSIVSAVKDKSGFDGFSGPLESVLRIFVPLVLTIALVSAGWNIYLGDYTEAFRRFLAVLVIACPCAIGIALPLALSLAGLKALQLGAIVKNSRAFLLIHRAKTFSIDKTGTLTSPNYSVLEFHIKDEETKDRLFCAQATSTHPLAVGVVEFLKSPKSFYTVETSHVSGNRIEFVFTDKKVLSIEKKEDLTFYVKIDGQARGSYKLRGAFKDQLETFFGFVKEKFKNVVVLSGDKSDPEFESFLKKFRIEAHFELSPLDKKRFIQQSPKPVIFAGDGINDAQALQSADVGISFTESSLIVQDRSDVVMTKPNLKAIEAFLRLSSTTYGIVSQNLMWAFLYNILAVPLAAFGYVYPAIGAISMFASDLIVVLNSLRIIRFEK
ncbi:MAG: HAD-IC family P-type ATPase, partial [Deltaproteobacteria bacterium]|nr:HAD-IC family P-type ATPase [Deltaproteobacteria bacterium]